MAENDFEGSIAQTEISFSIVESIQTVVGQNFFTAMMFIDDTNVAANFATPVPVIGDVVTVTKATFASILIGPALEYATSFFDSNSISQLLFVVYDSAPALYAGLTTQFNLHHALAYFKLIFETGTASAAQIALGELCNADELLSQFWVGTADTGVLANPMTTGIGKELADAEVEAVICYSAQTGIHAALAQLGLSLGILNGTGTPVGNPLDYISTTNVLASGTTGGSDNSNLTAAQQTAIKANYVGFFLTVGNGTGAVALFGGLTNEGNIAAVQWIEQYINYKCQVRVAEMFTDPAAPAFKTNTSYQKILAIMQSELTPFVNLGRLSNLVITKTTFANLPPTTGTNIIIPNAWVANFNQSLHSAVVQGTLNIVA